MEGSGFADEPRFDVFLSYNTRDRAVVEPIARRLKREGFEPWLDRWSLTAGAEWQRGLGAGLDASRACAVFVGPHDLGVWEFQETAVALHRAASERSFRVFPVLLPGIDEPFDPNRLPHFLRVRMWVDFRRGLDDPRALQDLINAVRGVPFGADVPSNATGVRGEEVAPYRGLQVFGEDDARLFFGRDRELQRLVEKLKSSRFLAVLGPSGSGKSSLVRAGLIPRLHAGALGEGARYRVCVLRPGAAPLTALAAQVAKLQPGQAMQATLNRLAEDRRSLHLSVELALADRPATERVVVVVDQLEEAFTLCDDESQRRQLFAALVEAASAPGGRTVVIVTLRADFYARCGDYPELGQLVAAQQALIGPMDADGLRQAIQEPALRVDLELEQGLSDTILADVADEPGALPLLQHALLELWKRRRGTMLTLEGYRRTGGVHGALAQRAEEIYCELTDAQQQIARRMLLRLTQPGQGTEDTRRRAPRRELTPAAPDTGDFEDVLDRLVDARLLTTGRDETDVEIVDVAHEALVRGWPRLRGWIDADRQDLIVHRRITAATAEWTREQDASALYAGARLAEAQALRERDPRALNDAERAFLDASAEREEAARRKELEDARTLADAQSRATRGYRLVALVLLAAVVVAIGLVIIAQGARDDAQRQAIESGSLALVSASSSLRESHPDIALLLAFDAYRTSPRAETRSAMIAARTEARDPGIRAIMRGHTDAVHGVAFGREGRMASASGDGTVRLWDVRAHKQLGAPMTGHTGPVYSVAFSPDGRRLATGGADATVRLWDVDTHRQVGTLRGHDRAVTSVAFSPDGHRLATGSDDATVRLWDAGTNEQLGRSLIGHEGPVYGIAFQRDGRRLASAGEDGTVRLWDTRTRTQLGRPLTGDAPAVYGVAFSPDGRTLATANDDQTVGLWDVDAREQVGTLTGHGNRVNSVAFSPDGRRLASSANDGTVRVWSVATHKQLGAPPIHRNTSLGVAFSPDGRTLATANGDHTVRLWNVRAREQLGAPLTGHRFQVNRVAFHRDGRRLASAGSDGTVRLWDARTHEQVGASLTGHKGLVNGVAFSPDRRTLASAGDDRTVRLWDLDTHEQVGTPLTGHLRSVTSVAFSPDGRTLASADLDATVRLWDVGTREQLAAIRAVRDVAFSPDGRTLATGANDDTARLWDVRTHRQLGRPLAGHDNTVGSLAFSPDGRTLATGSDDATLRLWDVRTHEQLGTPFTGHTRSVNGVAFSSDGRTLASGSDEPTARLWDVSTHRQLGAPLPGHSGSVNSVAFSPDGRTLATASSDSTILLWNGLLWRTLAELRTEVCRLVVRGLSRAEWEQYAGGIPYRNGCP